MDTDKTSREEEIYFDEFLEHAKALAIDKEKKKTSKKSIS